MTYTVFISHAYRDIDLAQDLARRLKEIGVKVILPERDATLDKDIGSKADMRNLENSDEIMFLLTDEAVNNLKLRIPFQAGAAFSLGKHITPILIGPPQGPEIFKSFHPIRYADLSAYLTKLRERTSSLDVCEKRLPTPDGKLKKSRARAVAAR